MAFSSLVKNSEPTNGKFTSCKNLHSLPSLEPHGHQSAASPNFSAISRKHIGTI